MRYLVTRSFGDGWFWIVPSSPYPTGFGWSSTYDQAFRDCRNFIKRNQGWLYR